MILTYPVQRQMWPSSACMICSREAFGVSLSSAVDAIIMPGEQNPHCEAYWS